jgi:hypothetical protein
MKKLLVFLAVCALSGALGCGSPCEDLADRVCTCLPAGAARDNCKSGVKNQIHSGSQKPGDADQQFCQQLLAVCVAPDASQNLCDYVQSPEGKVACGLACADANTPSTIPRPPAGSGICGQ